MSMVCKEKECGKKHYGHGWCKYHYDKIYYRKHQARIYARTEAWRAKIPGYTRDKHLRRTFGITLIQYDEMFKAQSGKCKLCGRKEWKIINAKGGKPHNLAVDHCHKTGKIRGLLCAACNTAIGHLQDDPKLLHRVILYIEQEGDIV